MMIRWDLPVDAMPVFTASMTTAIQTTLPPADTCAVVLFHDRRGSIPVTSMKDKTGRDGRRRNDRFDTAQMHSTANLDNQNCGTHDDEDFEFGIIAGRDLNEPLRHGADDGFQDVHHRPSSVRSVPLRIGTISFRRRHTNQRPVVLCLPPEHAPSGGGRVEARTNQSRNSPRNVGGSWMKFTYHYRMVSARRTATNRQPESCDRSWKKRWRTGQTGERSWC